MSRGEIVRKPLSVRTPSKRPLDQRLALRLPTLAARATRLINRLPPGSRLRQAVVWRAARLAYEAINRRDLEAVLMFWDRNVELIPPGELVEAGLVEASYRGQEGYHRYFGDLLAAWGEWRAEPLELIDLGDRLLMLGRIHGRGVGSGTPITKAYAALMETRGGKVVREKEYVEHAEALEAVGLH
jgi:ketosteroid isomerase-like protein